MFIVCISHCIDVSLKFRLNTCFTLSNPRPCTQSTLLEIVAQDQTCAWWKIQRSLRFRTRVGGSAEVWYQNWQTFLIFKSENQTKDLHVRKSIISRVNYLQISKSTRKNSKCWHLSKDGAKKGFSYGIKLHFFKKFMGGRYKMAKISSKVVNSEIPKV